MSRESLRSGRRATPVRHALRYGLLLWAMAAVVGIEVAVALQRGAQWRGDVVWTIDWLSVSFVIVGPVVAGFAAMDTARLSVGSEHYAGQRFWRTPASAVGRAYGVGIGLAHLLVTVGVLIASYAPSFREGARWIWDPFTGLAILAQLAMLAFFIAVGTFVGRFLSPVLGGITAALAALVCVYTFAVPGDAMSLLEGGAATVPRVGYAYSAGFLTVQILLLCALVAALCLVRPVRSAGPWRPRVPDAVLAAVAVAAVALGTAAAPSDRLVPTAAEPDYCAAVLDVPTCYYPQHARITKAFQDELWVVFTVAEDNGYDALIPSKVVEASRTVLPSADEPGVGTVFVSSDHLGGAAPTTWEVVQGLVEPVHCPQVSGELPPSEAYWEDLLALTATWAMLHDPVLGERNGYFGDLLSPEDAATLLHEFQTCTYAF